MRHGHAILEDKKVVPVDDFMVWAVWFQNTDRHVAHTHLGDVRVSTVFLGLDHGWGDKPLWFETMIFGGPHSEYQERYETWDEAELGHAEAVRLAREGLN